MAAIIPAAMAGVTSSGNYPSLLERVNDMTIRQCKKHIVFWHDQIRYYDTYPYPGEMDIEKEKLRCYQNKMDCSKRLAETINEKYENERYQREEHNADVRFKKQLRKWWPVIVGGFGSMITFMVMVGVFK